MNFSSSERPSHTKINNKKTSNTNDKHKAKVKIPNYTTPVQNTSKSNYRSISSSPSNIASSHGDSTYKGPVGVPMMPLYGYDNYDDAEKDWAYFRQLHPGISKRVLKEVDVECDKLEYDGSCMFDEYPDRVYLGKIVDRIYINIKGEIEEPVLYGESLKKSSNYDEDYDEVHDCESKRTSSSKDKIIKINQYNRGGGNRRPPVRSNNWLKDLVEILLYQEMINRRRRYRSRRRWF